MQTANRLAKGANGRDAGGRFVPGCAPSPGNPQAKRVHRLRSALLKTVTPDDMRAIVGKLLEMAKGGDMAAIRELLDRTIGKADSDGTKMLQVVAINGRSGNAPYAPLGGCATEAEAYLKRIRALSGITLSQPEATDCDDDGDPGTE